MSEADPCARTVTWDEQTYNLNLNHPWVRKVLNFRGISGVNGSSPAACLGRFEAGSYTLGDVERVLELGLIGAGTSEREADTLLDQHVRHGPIGANAAVAANLLVALFVGKPNADTSA
jgi:tail tube GTA-gp10-like protein